MLAQDTPASRGGDPIFEKQFRFPVEMDHIFTEYLKQDAVRFTVFDENEQVRGIVRGISEVDKRGG